MSNSHENSMTLNHLHFVQRPKDEWLSKSDQKGWPFTVYGSAAGSGKVHRLGQQTAPCAERGVEVLLGVLSYKPNTSSQRFHQTEKPLELMRQIMRITSPGGTIFDPFMGSGTTLLAAVMEGYNSVGCEMSGIVHDIAERL